MLLVQESNTGKAIFLSILKAGDESVTIGGNRLNEVVTVCITARRGNNVIKRISFGRDEFLMLPRFLFEPTDLICRFTTNGVRTYTITWMESDSPQLDSIYLSLNYDDDEAVIIRPPLAAMFVALVRDVCDVIKLM